MIGSDFLPNEGSQAVDRIGIKDQSEMDDPEQPESEPESGGERRGRVPGRRGGEGDPIRVDDLKRLDLENMPDAARSYRY